MKNWNKFNFEPNPMEIKLIPRKFNKIYRIYWRFCRSNRFSGYKIVRETKDYIKLIVFFVKDVSNKKNVHFILILILIVT